jgi:hypothetical protein
VSRKQLKHALAALGVTAAVLLGGCGDDNAVDSAQEDIQQQAEDFTQGLPDQASDAREQAQDAADQLQDQLDSITNGAEQP